MNKIRLNKNGFTLVELVVVVAIIAILSAVVITNINSSRKKARDAKRISDIAQIQLALEQYFNRCGVYPAAGGTYANPSPNPCPTGISFTSFISVIPKDPSTGANYGYYVSVGNLDYILKAVLENPSNSATSEGLTFGSFSFFWGGATYSFGPCAPLTVNYCIGPK